MESLTIYGENIARGERKRLEIKVAKLFDYTPMSIPVEVIRGKEDGPVLFLTAAIHGDEINGVEIIKRILSKKKTLGKIKGTLIAVPIVNVFGFNRGIRYLPDRRDLNRCFPGNPNGSLGAQIANTLMSEVVSHCSHGIDFHTGSLHRTNLPQIRASLDDEETRHLAEVFGVPVLLNSSFRDGSLRQAVSELGIPMLLFEGGEALRHDDRIIQSGVRGVIAVMQSIGMLEYKGNPEEHFNTDVYVARSSHWVRAPHSGSLRVKKNLGTMVTKGQILGELSNPFGGEKISVQSDKTGIIIGKNLLPLVNRGDALFHIAGFEAPEDVEESLEIYEEWFEINE